MRLSAEPFVSRISPAPAARASSATDAHGRARDAYDYAVSCARRLMEEAEHIDVGLVASLSSCIDRLTALLEEDNQHLVSLAARSTPGNYLYGHIANVVILSLRVGLRLGWDGAQVKALGLAAFLHDIGLKHWLNLGLEERRLTPDELRRLKLSRGETLRLVRQSSGLDLGTLRAVSEILRQARVDGPMARRPRGLAEPIHQASQIIAVCDSYEAMSHPRGWRPALTPHEAIKEVVKLPRSRFDREILRHFLSQMTLYPPGSYLRLETGEVGRVMRVDPRFPSSPVVVFVVAGDGQTLPLPWYVDLRSHPLLHIEEAVDETALDIEDPRLKALLHAERWWF